jgi:glycosyltransferase involved in cell wall biosynthesis
LTRSSTLHINYCHQLPRYLWEPIEPAPLNGYSHWADTRLRQYDYYSAQRVDRFAARSETVARCIRKFYRRPAEVIAPPVPVQGWGQAGQGYYLYVGDLNEFQPVDLVMQACNRLGRSLWVVGAGSAAKRLQHLAGKTVRFLGTVPLEEMDEIYAGAIALITPSVHEDFSFAPVEAMGRGIPVIAAEGSGIKDVILNYRTGLLFSHPTVESLEAAIIQFEKLRFSAQACIERAEEFAESVFVSKFEWFVAKALDDHRTPTEDKGEKARDIF